jgi:hypothetical protein
MVSWVSDPPEKLKLYNYSDADFGSDPSMKSTSGSFTHLIAHDESGNITSFCQLSSISEKQTCVSHSTPEAELVAGDHSIRSEGIPLLQALSALHYREFIMEYFQDNETAAHCIRTGRTNALRHVGRTHRISISWLHEQSVGKNKTFNLNNCKTDDMKADIFTKSFTDPVKWNQNCLFICHIYPESSWIKASKPCAGQPAAPAKPAQNQRLIIEFCCGPESRLGQVSKCKEARGCKVERITETHDVTTESGVNHVMELIDKCNGSSTTLFAAMPCTGGQSLATIQQKVSQRKKENP